MIDIDQLVIREATSNDLEAIHAITQAAYAELRNIIGAHAHIYAETPEQLGERLADGWVILLAELAGQPVGAVRITQREGELYIGRLAVVSDAQHHGIGRALMAAAEEQGRAWGLFTARLGAYEDVLPSRPYYERLGYQVIERVELRNSPGRYFWAMCKQLNQNMHR